jgi:sugar (pentulose or hexulose) kinase
MAHAAANRALTVGVSPEPMAEVVAVKAGARAAAKAGVKDVAKDGVAGAAGAGANAPDQASVTVWTPTASRAATTA